MNVVVYTSNPEAVSAVEIQRLLEAGGYFVLSVEVES